MPRCLRAILFQDHGDPGFFGALKTALHPQESRWQLLQPSGSAPTPRSSHTAVWRSGIGGMLLFGGYGSNGWKLSAAPGGEALGAQSPQLRSAERPPPVRGRGGWGDLGRVSEVLAGTLHEETGESVAAAPAHRHRTDPAVPPQRGVMLLFGGYDGDRWKLSAAPGGGALEAQSPQLRSPERPPPVRGRGGWGTRDEAQKEVVAGAENRWQQLQPSGDAPTPRDRHSAVWRAETGGMLVFGGYSYSSVKGNRPLREEKRWQQLQPSGTAPPPRYDHTAVWRSGTGGMLVYGGEGSSGYRWKLSVASGGGALEAQSPQLRLPERPPPVRGRGGWGGDEGQKELEIQSFQELINSKILQSNQIKIADQKML
eukprot:Skav220438  [mRNA]  locus=scaffold2346:52108:55620:+ [translate_table: standard]